MIYLVRLTTPGAIGKMRDGTGKADPMIELRADAYAKFKNIPAGCTAAGGIGVEVIPCDTEKDADALIKSQSKRLGAAAEAFEAQRRAALEKKAAQLGKPVEELGKPWTAEQRAAFEGVDDGKKKKKKKEPKPAASSPPEKIDDAQGTLIGG